MIIDDIAIVRKLIKCADNSPMCDGKCFSCEFDFDEGELFEAEEKLVVALYDKHGFVFKDGDDFPYCPNCGEYFDYIVGDKINFCPHCGIRLQ